MFLGFGISRLTTIFSSSLSLAEAQTSFLIVLLFIVVGQSRQHLEPPASAQARSELLLLFIGYWRGYLPNRQPPNSQRWAHRRRVDDSGKRDYTIDRHPVIDGLPDVVSSHTPHNTVGLHALLSTILRSLETPRYMKKDSNI